MLLNLVQNFATSVSQTGFTISETLITVVNIWHNLLHPVTLIQPGSRLLSTDLPFKVPLTTPTHWGRQGASVKAQTF